MNTDLDKIQARHEVAELLKVAANGDSHTRDYVRALEYAAMDVPALLALVRSQQAQIDLIANQINAAEMLCRMNGIEPDSAVVPAAAIRAALTATEGA